MSVGYSTGGTFNMKEMLPKTGAAILVTFGSSPISSIHRYHSSSLPVPVPVPVLPSSIMGQDQSSDVGRSHMPHKTAGKRPCFRESSSGVCNFGSLLSPFLQRHMCTPTKCYSSCDKSVMSESTVPTILSSHHFSDSSLSHDSSDSVVVRCKSMNVSGSGVEEEQAWGYFVDVPDEEPAVAFRPPILFPPTNDSQKEGEDEEWSPSPLHRTRNFIRRDDGIAFFDLHMAA